MELLEGESLAARLRKVGKPVARGHGADLDLHRVVLARAPTRSASFTAI